MGGRKEVVAIEDENGDQVRDQSCLAYAALEKVVGTLFQSDDGSRRLSRGDPAFIVVPEEAARLLQTGSEVSRDANHMGTVASNYTSSGDQTAGFVSDVQLYVTPSEGNILTVGT